MADIIEKICSINPLWLILVVNALALFLVPFLTYQYAHRNNLRVLKEKWLSEFRAASASYVGACSKLYYANDTRYQKCSHPNTPSDAERTEYIKRCEEAQAEVTSARARIRLLFKEDDSDFSQLEPLIEKLKSSVDTPAQNGAQYHMKPKPWNDAQGEFLKAANKHLESQWSQITK